MIRAFLVDDNPRSLKTLRYLLNEFCPQVKIVGEATSVEQAYQKFIEEKPNLIFLDIEMPRENGFELLKKLKEYAKSFQVIFVTAFDHFALKAIKASALDYVLKPVDHQELIKSVKRAEEKLSPQSTHENYLQFLQNIQLKNPLMHKIAMPTQNGYQFIPVQEIVRCEADGNYVRIILNKGSSFLATRRLKDLEDLLDQNQFLRVHRSHIVNLDYVQKYQRGVGGIISMSDGMEISVARAHRNTLMKALNIE